MNAKTGLEEKIKTTQQPRLFDSSDPILAPPVDFDIMLSMSSKRGVAFSLY